MALARDRYRALVREDLLAAAERVISRKGINGVTVRDILAEADVSPGTLYSHFGGKDALFEALAERALAAYVAQVTVGDDQPGSVLPALARMAFAQPLEGAGAVAEMRAQLEGAEQVEAAGRFNRQLVASLLPLARRARQAGSLAVEDVESFLELLDIIWDGMSRRAASGTFVSDYARVGAVAVQLLDAVAPTPEPAAAAAE